VVCNNFQKKLNRVAMGSPVRDKAIFPRLLFAEWSWGWKLKTGFELDFDEKCV